MLKPVVWPPCCRLVCGLMARLVVVFGVGSKGTLVHGASILTYAPETTGWLGCSGWISLSMLVVGISTPDVVRPVCCSQQSHGADPWSWQPPSAWLASLCGSTMPPALSMITLSDRFRRGDRTPTLPVPGGRGGGHRLGHVSQHRRFHVRHFPAGRHTLISVLMLRGGIFSKATAWVGILTHGFDLLHVLVIPFVPAIGVWLMIVAGPLYPVWFFMVGRRLLQLGKVSRTGDRSGEE